MVTLEGAALAGQPNEAEGHGAAGQELTGLALDEWGQVTALIAGPGRAEERGEMLTNEDPVC